MFDKLKLKTSPEFWIVSVIFAMGLLVRLYHLGTPSLVDDELTTVVRIDHSLWDTICLLGRASFPPLHYVILNLWVRIFGDSEWALRFPSAFFSGLTIIVIYKLGKELLNKDVGIISALLLALSPFAIHYAQFAKMYALFWFLLAGAFLFFFRFLKGQGRDARRFYIIASILCCYTQYTGFLFLIAQNIIFLLMGQRTRLKEWFTSQLIIVSFCVPWVIYFLSSSHEAWGLIRPSLAFDYAGFLLKSFLFIIGSGHEIWTHEIWAQYSFKLSLWELNCFLYVFLFIFLLVDILTVFYKDKKTGLILPYYCLFIWMAIPVLIYFIFDYSFIHIYLETRYVGFLQVPIILLVSSQINRLQGWPKKMLVLVVVIVAVINIYLYFRDELRFPQQDWRATARELTHDLKGNDIILSFADLSDFKYYYKGDTRRFLMIPEEESPAAFLMKKGLLAQGINSIFILYKEGDKGQHDWASEIKLNGFLLDYKVSNGGNGFLHFQRA